MNVRSAIQCGAICMADEFCETYSYKKDLKECDLYNSTALQNYSAVHGCSSYKLQGKLGFITCYERLCDVYIKAGVFVLTIYFHCISLHLTTKRFADYIFFESKIENERIIHFR